MTQNNSQAVVPFELKATTRDRRVYGLADATPLGRTVSLPLRLGYLFISAFLIGFIFWAALAPLAAGAVAPGIISPDGSRRTVQHLEGGIISEIAVRDGDTVRQGQPVVVLQSIQAASNNKAFLDQYRTLVATLARLEAEHANADDVVFPDALERDRDDPVAGRIMDSQRSILKKQMASHTAQLQILGDRIRQYEEQILAYESQVASANSQMLLIEEELVGKEKLLKKAIISKPEVLRLRRSLAELQGFRGEYLGDIAEARQKIGEMDTQRVSLDAERESRIATEMDTARGELAVATERLNASQDILDRTVVTAPISGRVVNSRYTSPGGVVLRGEPILDIVPSEEKLLIDARVSPIDIDTIQVGMPATVHLTAFASQGLPRIEGVVRSISADRIVDEATSQAYYLAKVEVSPEQLAAIDKRLTLIAGMPAEVLIVTSERTMARYLLQPFEDAFRRSFREN